MDDDKVQRFISRQDWISLLTPKPVPTYPKLKTSEVWQDIAELQTELTDIRTSLDAVKQRGAHIFTLPAIKGKLRQQHERRKLHLQRLRELSMPKTSQSGMKGGAGSDSDDNTVGPGEYEVRLDLSRPSFLSTRPKQPYPLIRNSRRSDKAFSSKEEISRMRGMDAPACTSYSPKVDLLHRTPTKVSIGTRSISHSRIPRVSQEKAIELLRGRLKPLGLDPDGTLWEIGGGTPTPVISEKGKYSIPRSVRKLDIRKCNAHADSLQNQVFNHSFVSASLKPSY